jgi:heat shock protein HtpX
VAEPLLLDEQIRFNKRRTVIVVALMLLVLAAVVAAAGFLLGLPWPVSLLIAGAAALFYFLISAGSGVPAILKATRAREPDLNVRQEKLLVYRVEELAIAAGLPKPRVYIQDSRDINAFAAGRRPEEAVVCVTTGALEQLDQEELEGVLAHELSHIKNYDVRLATYTIAVVGIIAILSEIVFRVFLYGGGRGGRGRGGGNLGPATLVLVVLAVVLLILAPFVSRMVYLAMSRRREYLADASGAYMTRNPEGLASALEKILHDLPDDPKGSKTVAALYIANPWKRALRDSVWSTHPPLERRIQILRGPGATVEPPRRPTGAGT